MLATDRFLAPSDRLREHIYEPFLPPMDDAYKPLLTAPESLVNGLDGPDPVFLMEVDPATARHTVEYAGRMIAFGAPSCKKQFLADPSTYGSS